MRALTGSVLHPDGLLSVHAPTAMVVESSPGTGAMLLPLKPERAHEFFRALAAGQTGA
ncbi:hypothetical protein BH20ACT2_BH20ACT2_01820 [soil metagenome]